MSKKSRLQNDALTDQRLSLLGDVLNAVDVDPELVQKLRRHFEAAILGLSEWQMFPNPKRWQRWLAVKKAHNEGAKLITGNDGAYAVASTAMKASNDPAYAGPSMIRTDYERIERELKRSKALANVRQQLG